MQNRNALRLASLGGLFLLSASVSLAQSIEAITKPSEDVTLAFVHPGHVARVLVKEGDAVAADALLVKQDDSAELVSLQQLKDQAESDVRVRAADADLAEKKVEDEKMKEAGAKGAVSRWDVDRARLAVEIARLSLELAKFEHAQDSLKLEESRLQIERMSLRSPIAGKVEKLFVQPGESSDALQKVVRVVKIDPLWIDVPVPLPLAKAHGLKTGQSAQVVFGPAPDETSEARVTLVAAVADAASDTITVRISVPNLAGRPAGEHVKVVFPTPALEK